MTIGTHVDVSMCPFIGSDIIANRRAPFGLAIRVGTSHRVELSVQSFAGGHAKTAGGADIWCLKIFDRAASARSCALSGIARGVDDVQLVLCEIVARRVVVHSHRKPWTCNDEPQGKERRRNWTGEV